MTLRLFDDETLRARALAMMRSPERAWALNEFVRWVREQPVAPEPDNDKDEELVLIPALVGTSAAARILGVPPQHIYRLQQKGRMPAPVEVEGGRNVFVRDEVEMLAHELETERTNRMMRRQ